MGKKKRRGGRRWAISTRDEVKEGTGEGISGMPECLFMRVYVCKSVMECITACTARVFVCFSLRAYKWVLIFFSLFFECDSCLSNISVCVVTANRQAGSEDE